jgi:hypothetical protein
MLAFRQLTFGLENTSQDDMVKGRDASIAAIERMEAQRQEVLLLGSHEVERACGRAAESIARAQKCLSDIIAGKPAVADNDWRSALADVRYGVENFRIAVRQEILPRSLAAASGSGAGVPAPSVQGSSPGRVTSDNS